MLGLRGSATWKLTAGLLRASSVIKRDFAKFKREKEHLNVGTIGRGAFKFARTHRPREDDFDSRYYEIPCREGLG